MDLQDPPSRWGIGEVLRLSWPASLAMLNSTMMRFVDGWMVSLTGPDAVAAQFVGGITSFIPEAFVTGVLLVVNTYVAQNYGAGRMRRCGLYAWAGLAIALVAAVLVVPVAVFAPELFRLAYSEHAPEIHVMEVMYFRYMILSLFLSVGARTLGQFFFGIHRPGVVLVTTLVANAVNLVGDYALVLGKFGLPAMGLRGAAIATVFSWGLLLAITLAVFLSRPMHERYGTRLIRAVRLRHCRDLFRIGWPAGVQFANDLLVWSIMIGKFAGMFGKAHVTASAIAMRYMTLSFMPAVGVGAATTALVGKYIAAGQPDLARKRAHSALLVAMIYMGTCGLLFWLFRTELVSVFITHNPQFADARQLADDILRIGSTVMIFAAVFQLFDALGIVYLGAMRGAGDTRWPMVATLALNVTVVLGGGYLLTTYVRSLESTGPWLAGSAYIGLLGLLLAFRFESGAWRKIDLLGNRG